VILTKTRINCAHIVWFGEEVPALDEAITLAKCDYFAVMGPPYKSILRLDIDFTPGKHLFYIDPKPIKIQISEIHWRLFLKWLQKALKS
jgi:hypothetical protein